ncbi:MAG TPA: hypothetical protein VED59_01160 [Acidimicrobiales bacterium]|nr:hypothetical protein [Acidimicrobiales bacterium]
MTAAGRTTTPASSTPLTATASAAMPPGAATAPGGPNKGSLAVKSPTVVATIRSEWTKMRTLRSTPITVAVAALLVIGLSALISFAVAQNHAKAGAEALAHPMHIIQSGWELGLLAFMVLGVMVISNEYSSGLISSTFMATPKRARVLAAKVVVFTLVIFLVAEIMSFANFFASHAVIAAYPFPNPWITDNDVLRSVIGWGIVAALGGLLGLSAGTLLRHTAGAIASCVGFIFILPGVLSALPNSWSNPIEEYWPTNAGVRVTELTQGAHTLTAWWGAGDLAAFVIVVLAAAGILLVKRDA